MLNSLNHSFAKSLIIKCLQQCLADGFEGVAVDIVHIVIVGMPIVEETTGCCVHVNNVDHRDFSDHVWCNMVVGNGSALLIDKVLTVT